MACLVVSDLHFPYAHIHTVPFLTEIKKKYKPDRVVLTGDELDKHALSYHESDPDLPSAGQELELGIAGLSHLYRLFPRADVLESNHGSLHYRKAKSAGIPRKYLKDYKEILDAPAGWNWHMDLTVTVNNGRRVYFHHGLTPDVGKAAARRGICIVQGHYHTKFEIQYMTNPDSQVWGMTVGCLIDDKSLAFKYNKLQVERPALGCGIIVNGEPKLLPMHTDANGNWTGFVP